MTRSEYFAALLAHDWYFAYSDDFQVWERGRAARAALDAEAKTDAIKAAMRADVGVAVFSGPAFGREKMPLPRREQYPADDEPASFGTQLSI